MGPQPRKGSFMRVGIYGGAFNPPHVGHLKAMIHAMAMGNLDCIRVVPSWKHAFGKDMVDFDDRFNMVSKMVKPYKKIKVSDYERAYRNTYTIDMIENVKKRGESASYLIGTRAPDVTYVLIIGQDNLDVAHKWHRWDDLTKLVEILVVPDCGPERSTLVREAYAAKDDVAVNKMVPPIVRDYIKKKKLY